jgi:hypothetical protein
MKYVKASSLHTPRDQSSYRTCIPDAESYNNHINKLQCVGGDGWGGGNEVGEIGPLGGGPEVGAIGPLGQVRL